MKILVVLRATLRTPNVSDESMKYSSSWRTLSNIVHPIKRGATKFLFFFPYTQPECPLNLGSNIVSARLDRSVASLLRALGGPLVLELGVEVVAGVGSGNVVSVPIGLVRNLVVFRSTIGFKRVRTKTSWPYRNQRL